MKATQPRDTAPQNFLKFAPITGFGLFGMTEKQSIAAAAKAAASSETRMLERLERSQQAMWDALDPDVQANYERQAKDTTPSVAT